MPVRTTPLLLSVVAALIVLGASVASAPAPVSAAAKQAKKQRDRRPPRINLDRTRDLWATINVCDTVDHPNTIGIRGSMPGLRDRPSKLRMRFRVQYKAKTDGKWHNADSSADSGWKTVGHTQTKVIESGQDFTFVPPNDGGSHLLRGSVRFKWKRRGRAVERERRITEAGHKSTAGSDPRGYSAAKCEITAP